MLSLIRWAWPCAAIFLLSGCGQSGPVLHEVRGQVSYGGAPLTTGTVSLRAVRDNETQHQPTGLINERGEYRIYTANQPGAPPGWYSVVVFATEPLVDTGKVSPGLPRSIIPVRYNNVGTSPFSFEVKPTPAAGEYDLQLVK
ncbi:hypothetical protein [Anatilimnocola floriformis]|uniref:hypothetical protein n=1 Tax=Anatilimnocola floriformis TaxID=2948575 RepID=UPI0020C2FD5E|nr:hypothetical protein [Anatilimnocola floriformis]